eukprot:CAMPEP_0170473556 /NCGR_PEP_ID=MMETSP0123-20130129/15460_1 /TAXON_ID=182087 /ORGANISM="Favella ehrenbergii, Strain Fehren 1" /LENGTH=103 /DNA_ID=CAMNT_0010742691 /DNA_START=507 /DNA_END=818 /DNA_ORIENTATION=-
MKDSKGSLVTCQQKMFEKLFGCMFDILEEVVDDSPDKDLIVQKLKEENEILRPLASLQYTLADNKLALKCTRLMKKHYPALLLDSIGEALFEFDLDLCSSRRS